MVRMTRRPTSSCDERGDGERRKQQQAHCSKKRSVRRLKRVLKRERGEWLTPGAEGLDWPAFEHISPGSARASATPVTSASVASSTPSAFARSAIVCTAEEFSKQNKNKIKALALAWDSEDSYSGDNSNGSSAKSNVTHSFCPSTPPLAQVNNNSCRSAKRRKGIPHRAPFDCFIMEY